MMMADAPHLSPAALSEPLIQVRGVRHSYGGVQAVAGVDLDVAGGQVGVLPTSLAV